MAIQNPNSLYSAGAVTFNSQPATQFYLQSLAKKRAKEEAIDNYFRDLGKGLTPAGMSPDDIPEFMNKVSAYKQFSMQNKEALRNPSIDNGRAYTEANKLYNDALEHSARSVGKVKNISQIPNLTPEQKERLVANGWDAIQRASLPVSDEKYRPFNPADIDYNPKDFTLDDEAQMIQNLTKNRKMTTQEELGATDPKTFLRTKITRNIYEPKEIQGMAQDAASEYLTNKSFKQKIDQLFEGSYNPTTGQVEIPKEYNEAFKSVYDKDIHVPQELAAAYALNKIQSQSVKTETEEDKFAQAKAMEGIKQANRLAAIDKRREAAEKLRKNDVGWTEPYLESVISKANSDLPEMQKGSVYKESPIITDPLLSKALSRNKQEPDVIRYKDGKFEPIYYQRYTEDDPSGKGLYKAGDIVTDAKGNPTVIESFSKPITKQQAKLLLLNVAPNSKLDAMEMGLGIDNESDDELPFQWQQPK